MKCNCLVEINSIQFNSIQSLCLSEETLKSVGPFYLVSMPVEVKHPKQGVNRHIPVVDSTF